VLGPNTIGLERNGFYAERIKELQKAFACDALEEKHLGKRSQRFEEHGESADVKE